MGIYYRAVSKQAGLGPISPQEDEAAAQARADRLAALGSISPLDGPGEMNGLLTPFECACNTGGQVYITNFVCAFDAGAGWQAGFCIEGGDALIPYEIFSVSNLVGNSIEAAQWVWLGRGYTCNNYIFSAQPEPQAFYVLGSSSADPDGDGLSTSYEMLVSKTNPHDYDALSHDGHGTPDAWYLQHGLNPLTSGIGGQDPNGNGVPNWQEYLRGGNPLGQEAFSIWIGAPAGLSNLP